MIVMLFSEYGSASVAVKSVVAINGAFDGGRPQCGGHRALYIAGDIRNYAWAEIIGLHIFLGEERCRTSIPEMSRDVDVGLRKEFREGVGVGRRIADERLNTFWRIAIQLVIVEDIGIAPDRMRKFFRKEIGNGYFSYASRCSAFPHTVALLCHLQTQ
jgi:hypothetical protein